MTSKKKSKCPTPIGHAERSDGTIVNISCKSWKCPHCSKVNKKRILDRVSNGFRGNKSVYGVTLTEVTETEHEIMQHWATFRRLLLYHFGKNNYFWVKEFQQNGNRHLHILFEKPIAHALIKRLWTTATGGKAYIVWINEYEVHKSAGYLAKYITKSSNDERFGKHERRYGFSQGGQFVLDNMRQFELYGYLPPAPNTWVFHLGPPLPKLEDHLGRADWDGGGISDLPFPWDLGRKRLDLMTDDEWQAFCFPRF